MSLVARFYPKREGDEGTSGFVDAEGCVSPAILIWNYSYVDIIKI